MMDEFTIAKKLQAFKSVKPNENWASLNKANILAKEFEKRKSPGCCLYSSSISNSISFFIFGQLFPKPPRRPNLSFCAYL